MNTDWYEGFDETQENFDAAQRWMDLQVLFKAFKLFNHFLAWILG